MKVNPSSPERFSQKYIPNGLQPPPKFFYNEPPYTPVCGTNG